MPKSSDDPMRYIPTKDEHRAAYEAAPACHHPWWVEPLKPEGSLHVVIHEKEEGS